MRLSHTRAAVVMVVSILLLALAGQANAEDRNWDPTVYGTSGSPASWFTASNWNENAVPTNGQSVAHAGSCCNPEPYVDINNGGAGVNLASSIVRFDAKTNLLDSSAGDLTNVGGGSYNFAAVDDAFIADIIRFNGAGGASNDVYVPVIANTFTSNRHGAVFHVAPTVDTILANSGHQDRWNINVSPTGTITYIDLDENRGADGGSIDGYFAFNADTSVTTIDHTWSNLRVGAGATLTVDTLNYWDYTNRASDNNINPIRLNGDMSITTFNVFDVQSSITTELAPGTYGRIGHGSVDNEVAWITTGDGVLTVIPEPSAFALAAVGLLSLTFCGRRRRK